MKYKIPYLAFIALMISMMFGCSRSQCGGWSVLRPFQGAECNTCNPPTGNHSCGTAPCSPDGQSVGQPGFNGQIVPFGSQVTPYGTDPYGGIVPPNTNNLPGPVVNQ